jgi:dephospho-CoA kinase
MNKVNFRKEFIKKTHDKRIYHLDRPAIAITGGIATGKSTFCKILKEKYQFEIIDADQLVKQIYQLTHIKEKIKQVAPTCFHKDQIDFKILRQLFFDDKALQPTIENIIYQELPSQFLQQVNHSTQPFVMYDVPLLFEKDLQNQFDLTVLVYADQETQKARIKKRDHSSDEVINAILQKQLPIDHKRNLADVIIENNASNLKQLEADAESFYLKYFN